jgi:hypothetical protein
MFRSLLDEPSDMHEPSAGRARFLGRTLLAAGFLVGLCGCIGHTVLNIDAPASSTTTRTRGFAKITEIRDLRQFEAAPGEPSTPSLYDESQLVDSKVTARAVGRLRGPYGRAEGDYLLPEGRTVIDLMRGVVKEALQDKGYSVVDESSPAYAEAAPLAVDINQFWQWNSPSGLMEFTAVVTMRSADLIGSDAVTANSYAKSFGAFTSMVKRLDLFQRGMTDLAANMSSRIKAAPGEKLSAPDRVGEPTRAVR